MEYLRSILLCRLPGYTRVIIATSVSMVIKIDMVTRFTMFTNLTVVTSVTMVTNVFRYRIRTVFARN